MHLIFQLYFKLKILEPNDVMNRVANFEALRISYACLVMSNNFIVNCFAVFNDCFVPSFCYTKVFGII